MAKANNNPLLQKLSGMLGDTVVFKQYKDETVLSKKAKKSSKPPSADQIRARSIFSVASLLAHQILDDPEQLQHYTKAADARKLPNAHTAARQEALKSIYANPAAYEEMIAATILANQVNSNETAPAGNNNAQANIFETLPAPVGNQEAAGNPSPLNHQVADLTNAVQNVLLELQKVMNKATELLNAVNALTASKQGNPAPTT